MKIATPISTSTLGFPRMGPNRELKFALESFWKDQISEKELLDKSHSVEELAWKVQQKQQQGSAKIDHVTVGDQFLYDGMLTWAEYLGIVPKRFQKLSPGLERMFAMARGAEGAPALSKFIIVSSCVGILHT